MNEHKADQSLLLAIDTSTEFAGIGVFGHNRAVELCWQSGRNQTTSVLEQIDRCLTLAHIRLTDLDGIVIAQGPGMFNGLRVGMSLAKGLALATDTPLIGISTLAVTAATWTGLGKTIIAVVAAGRGRLVWQPFTGDEIPLPVAAPQNMTEAELLQTRSCWDDCLVAGEVSGDLERTLTSAGALVRAGAVGRRRPALLAELARHRIASGKTDDLTTLEPLYLHGQPVAVAK